MAKRRKKSYSRRRRSIGAVGSKTDMTSILYMVGGAVAARVITAKMGSKINPKILAAGTIGAGLILPRFVKGKAIAGIGSGMAVSGAVSLLQSTGVISAISGVGQDVEMEYLSGTDPLAEIAGLDEVGVIDEGTMSGDDTLSILSGDFDTMDEMGEMDEEY